MLAKKKNASTVIQQCCVHRGASKAIYFCREKGCTSMNNLTALNLFLSLTKISSLPTIWVTQLSSKPLGELDQVSRPDFWTFSCA